MKNLSPITDNKDITTKEYVDNGLSQKIGDAPTDGEDYVRNNGAWKKFAGSGDAEIIQGNYITVPTSAWVEDSTYVSFPYKADITVSGIDSNWFPMVTFEYKDAVSGNFCIDVESATNKVSIWAAEIPSNATILESIVCEHKVGYLKPNKVNASFEYKMFEDLGCTISGTGSVPVGQSATLSISIPSGKGITFTGWKVGSTTVSTSTTYTFTPTADTTVVAVCSKTATVTITGTLNATYCYISENSSSGTKHSSAGTFTMQPTGALYCYARARSASYSSSVSVNDTVVASHSKSTTATTYTAQIANIIDWSSGKSNINIACTYGNSSNVTIKITGVE